MLALAVAVSESRSPGRSCGPGAANVAPEPRGSWPITCGPLPTSTGRRGQRAAPKVRDLARSLHGRAIGVIDTLGSVTIAGST